jgi:hypothetical protein
MSVEPWPDDAESQRLYVLRNHAAAFPRSDPPETRVRRSRPSAGSPELAAWKKREEERAHRAYLKIRASQPAKNRTNLWLLLLGLIGLSRLGSVDKHLESIDNKLGD